MVTEYESPDPARLNAVATAIRQRDAKTAALLAEFDLAKGVQHPLLYTARAVFLSEQGRHEEALADFRKAADLSPSSVSAWSAVGICLSKLGQFDEAAEIFDRAAALQPASAILYYRKGRALEQARDTAGAKAAYLRAIAIDPSHLPSLGRLAFGEAQQGASAEARAYADRVLRADPSDQIARLVRIMSDIRTGRLEEAEIGLNAFLSDPAIDDQNRATAFGELGDLRDRQDRVDEAFEAYTQANTLYGRFYTTSTTASGVSMADTVSALAGYFRKNGRVSRSQAPRGPARTHAFLLGFLRSGTTLLEQVLASHPDVVTLEEKAPMVDAVQHFMQQPRDFAPLYQASERELDRFRALYWERVRKHGIDPANKVFVDKGPIYTVDLPVIMRLFPDAKILFALRDPRDVVLSCFRMRFNMNSTTYELLTLEKAASFYAGVMQLAAIYRDVIPMDLLEVRHESFVQDFETEARKVCAFLDLDWNDALRTFADRSKLGTISSASGPQIAQGLNREGVGRWHRYEHLLAPVLPVLQPWVEQFGYQ